MPSRHQRITNGQRAAVCALVIAGQPFVESCKVAGAPYRGLQAVLALDWWERQPRRRRWFGEELRSLEESYRDTSLRLDTVAALFSTSRREVQYLATEHGWPRRQWGRGRRLPTSLSKMDAERRNRFVKLRRIIGRAAAEQAIFGVPS